MDVYNVFRSNSLPSYCESQAARYDDNCSPYGGGCGGVCVCLCVYGCVNVVFWFSFTLFLFTHMHTQQTMVIHTHICPGVIVCS